MCNHMYLDVRILSNSIEENTQFGHNAKISINENMWDMGGVLVSRGITTLFFCLGDFSLKSSNVQYGIISVFDMAKPKSNASKFKYNSKYTVRTINL